MVARNSFDCLQQKKKYIIFCAINCQWTQPKTRDTRKYKKTKQEIQQEIEKKLGRRQKMDKLEKKVEKTTKCSEMLHDFGKFGLAEKRVTDLAGKQLFCRVMYQHVAMARERLVNTANTSNTTVQRNVPNSKFTRHDRQAKKRWFYTELFFNINVYGREKEMLDKVQVCFFTVEVLLCHINSI